MGDGGKRSSSGIAPPALRGIPFLEHAGPGAAHVELLSETQRHKLLRRASVRSVPQRTTIYHAGARATSVFIIGDGVAKSFRDLPSGRRRIALFLFPGDVCGLAEAGHYVNSVQTITAARIYELNVQALTQLFRGDAELELQFLCKVVHVLREAQHHNILLGRRDAVGRLAMLLRLLQKQSTARGQREIPMPMTRTDIANYLGLSLEAIVRASRRLELQGIVEFVGRHRARIADPHRFEGLVSNV